MRRIARVVLAAPAEELERLEAFYGRALGLRTARAEDRLSVTVGDSALELAAGGPAFYHFAFLVAADRFDAAHAWLEHRTALLPHADGPATVFDFPDWDARACYCHDPAGNIVELIGHPEAPAGSGPFGAGDLLGISEIGLVTPDAIGAADALERELGLELWAGAVSRTDMGLGFVGRKGHTLILSPPGRGWLPTGRPAEPHPVEVEVTGARAGEARLPGAPHVVRCPG